MKRAGEDREIANNEYQATVADQRATEKLLTATLNVLKGFYEKAALTQTNSQHSRQPAGFKKNDENKGGGVMGMINSIINDAKALQAEAMRAEEDSQTAYEIMVKDTNEMVTEKTKDILQKTEQKAKVDEDNVNAK